MATTQMTRQTVDDLAPRRQRWRMRRSTGSRPMDALIAGGSLAAGLALWEFVGQVVITNRLFFAPFSEVIRAAVGMTLEGVLINDLMVTGGEVLYGMLIAAVLGISIGMAVGLNRTVRVATRPWMNALYSTPIVAIAPLFILWFGIGIESKIATAALCAVFPILINCASGFATTDQSYIDVARAFGFGKTQVFRKILLPSALAFIATGIRLGIGRALVGAVVAEFFGAKAGLGFRILVSGQAFQTADLLAGVLVLALTGVVALGLVERVERRLAPWRLEVEL